MKTIYYILGGAALLIVGFVLGNLIGGGSAWGWGWHMPMMRGAWGSGFGFWPGMWLMMAVVWLTPIIAIAALAAALAKRS